MATTRWIAAALGLTLAGTFSLLWHFAAPLAPFDPAAVLSEGSESSSTSLIGYLPEFTEQGPAWFPSSLVIGAITLCAVAAAAWIAGKRRANRAEGHRHQHFWWPLPTSAVLGTALWAVTAVSPPPTTGIALTDPDSIAALMSRSPLLRESSEIFLVECLAASIVIGVIFIGVQRALNRR